MRKIIVTIIFLLVCTNAFAQFFYEGRGNANVKWMQIEAKDYKLLYPDYFKPTALKMSGYMDSIMPYVKYGMKKKNIKLPIVLETQSQLSNGLVVWAPKREELVTTPPANTYAQPWLKQLSVHEYRHVTQISNLKSGLTKIATWVIGEGGIVLGLFFMPDWSMEGDATNAETQLAEYGRGMQPSFNIGYRAMMNETDFSKYSTDNLLCGSYKNYYPNIYEYGYLVSRAVETYTRPDIWGDIYVYTGRWPVMLFPHEVYLKTNYKTTTGKVAKRAFKELGLLWKPYSQVENNYQTITKPSRSYTTYSNPVSIGQGSVVAQKRDYDTPNYLIAIDSLGVEKRITQLGNVSSRVTYSDGFLYWTEYQAGLIYEKQNYSVIKRINVNGKLAKSFCGKESNYFVTPIDDGFATVKYDTVSNGYIQLYDQNFKKRSALRFDELTSLHGLAWDSVSQKGYFIALDEKGMWIGAFDVNNLSVEVVKEPSVVTMRDLKASNGKLYFGSIESGKDEIHTIDIASGVETRLTNSKYGAIEGMVGDSVLYASTYTAKGWMLAKQNIEKLDSDTVQWSRKPQNKLNFDWVDWQVDAAKADSIKMTDTVTKNKVKRFSKTGRRFNFHSWAPVATDINGILGEREFKLGFGATGFFQSTLSDMYGSVSVGGMNNKFWGLADFVYTGLPVQFAVRAEYGGGNQLVYGAMENDVQGRLDDYFSISARAFAPLRFNSGAIFRTLTPSFAVTHYNAKVYDPATFKFNNGFQKWDASVVWSESNIASYRSLKPRLGYLLMLGASGAFHKDFALQWSGLARGYLPGFMKNHSLILNASYQIQEKANYNFTNKTLPVRGVVNNYAAKEYFAASIDYTFPLFYPDFGIPAVIYFKRIALNVFANYSSGKYFNNIGRTSQLNYFSAGFDVQIDFSLIRSLDQGVVFGFAFPTDRNMFFSVGYNMNF